MAKVVSDGFMDGGLDDYIGSVTLSVCTAEPANQAAIAGLALATHTLTGGDWSKADGDTSGRKATMAQQADISVTTTGTATHIAVDDGTDFAATTCTSTALTSGGTVTVNAFDREIQDPT